MPPYLKKGWFWWLWWLWPIFRLAPFPIIMGIGIFTILFSHHWSPPGFNVGVMEWWSEGVMGEKEDFPISTTPLLHYSNTPFVY